MRVVDDLPFVPSTWTDGKLRSGEPRAVIIRRIRSRPKRMPNSSSERSARSASASPYGVPAPGTSALRPALPPALGVGMPAQVVDEHRPQGLAELAVAAIQRVFDEPFGGLDVEVRLARVAARSRRS